MIVNKRKKTYKTEKNERKKNREKKEEKKQQKKEQIIRKKSINFNHHAKVNHLFSVLCTCAIYI